MAEPRLGPEELDRLEDALEDLELCDDLTDPSALVSARLADFKFILEASREALPLEDVPVGVLDGVLAEARVSSEDIVTPAAAPARDSFWSRMRRAWLVPGLAVAGSAALVLVLLQPTFQAEPSQAEAGAVAVNDATPPSADAPARMEAGGERLAEEEVPPAAKAGSMSSTAAPTLQRSAGLVAPSPAKATAPPVPEADEAPVEVDEPEPSAGWNAVEDGDSSRKGGDCFSARNHYAQALDDGNDSVRARAYVGMGLCKREEGNDAAANEFFRKARELDEDAMDFAETQSKKPASKPSVRRPRKKASGSKRKSKMNFDEVADPLQGL